MSTAVHLVLVVAEPAWPALQALVHWHRLPGGIARLHLHHPEDGPAPAGTIRRLERFARELAPQLEVVRVDGPAEPSALRHQLQAWMASAPDQPWVVVFAGTPHPAPWAAEGLLARPGCQVLFGTPGRSWTELRRDPSGSGAVLSHPFPGIRRDLTDDLPLSGLVRGLLPDDVPDADFRFAPATLGPLPLTAITEALLASPWRWAEAFRAAGAEIPFPSNEILFERFIGALVVALDIRPALRRHSSRSRSENAPSAEPTAGQGTELWIHHGGRLVVLDIDLDEDPGEGSPQPALAGTLARLADQQRLSTALGLEWVLIRPRQKAGALVPLLARTLGVQVLDQQACHTLPSRLAALFGLPLSAQGAELERRFQTWLSQTGRTRLFGDEPAVLRQPAAGADADPLWTRVDGWLEQVRAERGQNWLLWTHRGRAYLRVPAGGRPAAAQEWRLLTMVTSGADDREVTGRPTPDGSAVVVELPESAGACRRLSAWLQPFANRKLTFADAQARFAAQARVDAEAAHTQDPKPALPGPKPAPPAPRPEAKSAGPSTPRPQKPPRPPRPTPPPPPEPKPRTNPLADLDRALDDALGG